MSRDQTTLTELARLGFAELAATSARLAVLDAPDLLPSFANAADPDQALGCCSGCASSAPAELAAVLGDEDAAARLILVLGASRRPRRVLLPPSGAARGTAADPLGAPPTAAEYDADLVASVAGLTGEAAWTALRVRYRHHLAAAGRVGSRRGPTARRDRPGGRGARRPRRRGARRIARCGARRGAVPRRRGRETRASRSSAWASRARASSTTCRDVDVIFVAEGSEERQHRPRSRDRDPARDADDARHPRPRRRSRRCGRWTRTCGPRARTARSCARLESHLAYYERWAKSWEFQALLKARPLAGDLELGERYVAAVAPMVWSSASREGFVDSVQRMRERVTDNIPRRRARRAAQARPRRPA